MARKYWFLLMGGLVIGLFVSGRFARTAQEGPAVPDANPRTVSPTKAGELSKVLPDLDISDDRQSAPRAGALKAGETVITIQEALLRPYRFPFAQATSLEQVCAHLRDTLKGSVVLDLAALKRKGVESDDTVKLELDGVRLKTGLKLLLDQVGLTYHVVAEDNLMIISDSEGSEDPADRIWAELRALHRDLHAVQDAVDDLGDLMGLEEGEGGPRVRKPTIIEEMPEHAGGKPGAGPATPGRGGEKPEGATTRDPGPPLVPPRIPLAGPHRRL